MKEKILQLIREQIKLIEPISINGTTEKIRKHAREHMFKLKLILDTGHEDFIEKNIKLISSCCMSLYNKLIDDSINLPTVDLRELAKKEANEVMEIWVKIEKTNEESI